MSLHMKIKDSTDSFTQIIQNAGITSLLLINYRGNSYNLIRCPLDFEKFLKTLGARSSKSEFGKIAFIKNLKKYIYILFIFFNLPTECLFHEIKNYYSIYKIYLF